MKFLEVVSVQAGYGDADILKGVSLSVEQGEIFAIVGSNGAGKSTLLNTISGLLRSKGGEIYFENQPITLLPPHKIVEKGITQIPEGRRLFPYMSVLKNLQIGSFNHNARQKRNDSLEKVFSLFPLLKERKNTLAKTLSGGEQQMLAIGRGMMANPTLLILDEPSLGLSPILVERILDTIRRINQSGVTILLVEQKVDVSLGIANNASVLENGKIVLSDSGKALLNNVDLRKAYLGK